MKFILISALVLAQTCSFGQDSGGAILKAQDFDNENKPAEALAEYKKALEIEQIDGNVLYNAARVAAQTGDKTLAFKYLHLAVKQCFINIHALKSSKSLLPLQHDKRWQPLMQAAQRKLNQTDTVLQQRLIDIQQNEQNTYMNLHRIARKYGYESDTAKRLSQQALEQSHLNSVQVSAILDKYGWLGADQIGEWATRGLWLVIQHADGDLKAQQKYLPLLRATVKRGQASKHYLALLEDRVAVNEGRKQLYGSQMHRDSITLISHVSPIAEPESVDKRRAKMGLEPLSVYLKEHGVEWTEQEYPKQK
jgi:hypothetical protein